MATLAVVYEMMYHFYVRELPQGETPQSYEDFYRDHFSQYESYEDFYRDHFPKFEDPAVMPLPDPAVMPLPTNNPVAAEEVEAGTATVTPSQCAFLPEDTVFDLLDIFRDLEGQPALDALVAQVQRELQAAEESDSPSTSP